MIEHHTPMDILTLAVQQHQKLAAEHQQLRDHYHNVAVRLALHQLVHGPLLLDIPEEPVPANPVNVRVVLDEGQPTLVAVFVEPDGNTTEPTPAEPTPAEPTPEPA
jgi:hypothetical protein